MATKHAATTLMPVVARLSASMAFLGSGAYVAAASTELRELRKMRGMEIQLMRLLSLFKLWVSETEQRGEQDRGGIENQGIKENHILIIIMAVQW